MVAIWVHTENKKKMPTLASLLDRPGTKFAARPVQTVAQQRAVLATIAEQYGLTVRKASPLTRVRTHGE